MEAGQDGSRTRGGPAYIVNILYDYEYGESLHESGSYYPVRVGSSDKALIQDLCNRYHVGQMSECYVNSIHPEQAFLVARWLGVPPGKRWVALSGGVLAGIGL